MADREEPTNAALAAHLRDPATDVGFLPQWVRDSIADDLEKPSVLGSLSDDPAELCPDPEPCDDCLDRTV